MNKRTLFVFVFLATGMAHADAGLPDPTRPADYLNTAAVRQVVTKQRAEFKLNAIRISEVDRSAIINGKLVRIGDEIGSAKVREINIQEVVLDYDRKIVTVPLYAQGINKQFKTSESEDK